MKASLELIRRLVSEIWQTVRHVTGDDAYERYLRHWQTCHGTVSGQKPLDRKEFHRASVQHRWNGIKRCC